MKQLRIITALAAAFVALPALAAEPAYLFDALSAKEFAKSYRAAWEKLMKDVQPEPDWLVHFNHNYDGDSGALAPVTVAGKTYTMSFVCKPADCAGKKFVVLFEPGGARAVGSLGGKVDEPEYFGSPSGDEKDVMAKAFSVTAGAAAAKP